MATFTFTIPTPAILRRFRFTAWVDRKHWRRYVLGWVVSVAGVVALGVCYKLFWPATFTSEMTLILPGAGAGANVSLNSIGQSTSIISSPFGQSTLSPKVIYKSIAESDQVLGLAAEMIGLEPQQFGKPRIKLIDQTALMIFEVRGKSPVAAREKGIALLKAIDGQLDSLRSDEIEKRAGAVRTSLADYRLTLDQARQRVLEFQKGSGLVSSAQFSDLTAASGQMTRRIAELRGDLARIAEQQTRLVESVGLTGDEAARALALAGNPNFIRLFRDLAETQQLITDRLVRFGVEHPQVLKETARYNQLLVRTQELIDRAGLPQRRRALSSFASVDAPAWADIIANIVRGDVEMAGKQRQLEVLEKEAENAQRRISQLSEAAATLEDLQKKQIVAEAVYSSAVARLDTNRADVYASYPLVQVLAEPTLPELPSSPRWLFAAIGIIGGSIMATLAWVMAWLYQLFVLKRSKNV